MIEEIVSLFIEGLLIAKAWVGRVYSLSTPVNTTFDGWRQRGWLLYL
jgi:hypothetical protein